MKVTILGVGAWGTALGLLLSKNGNEVTAWGHRPEFLETLRERRVNDYLPGFELPDDWRYESEIAPAVRDAEAVVIAVPSKVFREIAQNLGAYSGTIVSVTKGIEYQSGLTMSGILKECAPQAKVAALSGPTLAMEVALGYPSAIVAASVQNEIAEAVQNLFHCPNFRVYTSTDILGVELGGALKNVIAIAAGVGDGFGFGDNTKAALVTRAIPEIRRLGVACGAQPETFAGLSGLGDLMVTCFSKLSRNRTLGERLWRGEKLDDIVRSSSSVAEGLPTARSAHKLAAKLHIATPIIDEVYAMLYEGKNLEDSLRDLTSRSSKPEIE
jgi:glycerol-3-phosphate dehydrogenase (NAD(P)+)